ncbi:MAG TPA: DUF262 domain-containing protein [Micromonosporaceae bacterium]
MSLSIRQAIEKVVGGQLRIPKFQRGFVWDAERVAYLMDSIYKGYPFGSLILWRTKTQLRSERTLGPFALPERDPDYPIDYVLDGQQRLTSVFGVFQTELQPNADADTAWTHIYFDFVAAADLQESQFVALSPSEADPERFFPIGTLFNVTAYREATRDLPDTRATQIDSVQATFKEAHLPVQTIETDDRAKVAIVFERVNRLGVELDTLQLLSAWTWSEEFDLQERFQEMADEFKPFGFAGVGEDTNLLLRVCAAVVAADVSAPTLLGLNGTEVRNRFDEVVNGLRGAIDHLRKNFHVERLENLPYPAMLVPLAVFFATRDGVGVNMTGEQNDELRKWFWRSCFGRRFSSGVLRNLNRDLAEARKLRASGTSALAEIPFSLDAEWFVENRFNISAVNTKTFILVLAQADPLTFVAGSPVHLGAVLQTYNRSEFHHLFPRAFLAGQGRQTDDINRLANFAIINSVDNKTLGGAAPSAYRGKMPAAQVPAILERALCPDTLFSDVYDTFTQERAEMLARFGRKLALSPKP